jgi:hypothetical protein
MILSSLAQSIARPIVSSVSKPSPIGGGDNTELIAEVGTFTSPTSTGTQVVSLDPAIWNGSAPKVVLFWGIGTTIDQVGPNARIQFGCGISSSSMAVAAVHSRDSRSTSDADRRQDNTKCITWLIESGTIEAASYVTDATGNQFSLNYSTASAVESVYNFLALGGDKLTDVFLDEITTPTSTGSVSYTGVGFQPDCLLAFGLGDTDLPPSTSTDSQLYFGLHDGTDSVTLGSMSENAVLTSNTQRQSTNNFIQSGSAINGSSAIDVADVSSLDSDGYTLNWTSTDGSSRYAWVLCLKGVSSKLITGDQPATNTTTNRSPGFEPKAALGLTLMAPSSVNVEDDARIGIGGSDFTNAAFSGVVDEHGQGTTDTDRIQDSNEFIKHIDHARNVVGSCALSKSGSTVTETWTDTDGTQREHTTLFLG